MSLDKCSKCGFCKNNCPIFNAVFDELTSPRGRVVEIRKAIYDIPIYFCTLCKACKIDCPAGIDLPKEFLKARQEMVKRGQEFEVNEEMMKNIRKHGVPFEKNSKGEPKRLYCC
jgi:glycolate oxidase iron-sulfur subunit